MDDGLGDEKVYYTILTYGVLILVLMDDGLGDQKNNIMNKEIEEVLILVLMDDGLGEQKFQNTIYQINKAQIL